MQAFSKLAKTGNTLLLPEKTGDVSSMVAQVCHPLPVSGQLVTGSLPSVSPGYGHIQSNDCPASSGDGA